jgi:hypothetical protein
MRDELTNYVHDCYEHEKLRKLDDVFVTDHEPVPPKYNTVSEEEDQDFHTY